ncbi:spore germination protein D [Pullulanibacillus pueri]|uniref:Germination protein n=1 Tax=Pullulanibacillus pueri TaxID=1437324 RepID=A0A8J2ZXS5_9BACL|nr:spore germination lipoprotein GerD [Pullulanibacillus pueri]MBM7683095.1 spore germination protein D [Pullulanibacillus pueri]GGH85268.1 germination protein [Pullulanibacillus pueri]
MHHLRRFGLILLLLILSVGCSSQPSAQGSNPDYQTTKKMVIDMLKSDDGQKAIQDILSDDQFKKELVINQDFVKKTITEAVASEKSKDFWEQMLADPEFSQQLATTMQKNNEKILKQLMNDPNYQEAMMAIFKAPDMESQYLDLLETQPFRKQIQKEIIETMESPLFSTQMSKALQKAVKQEMQQSESKSGGGNEGGDQTGQSS